MQRRRRHSTAIAEMTSPKQQVVHLRAHLGVRLERSDEYAVRGVLPLTSRCRTRRGHLSLGAIATMVDVAAVMRANRAHPSPLVTSHLSLRVPGFPDSRLLQAYSVVVRAGRARVVSAVQVTDQRGHLVGLGTVSSDALTGDGTSHRRTAERDEDDFYIRRPPAEGGMPIDDFLALEPAGEVQGRQLLRMPFHETLRNVNGVLHGGGAALFVEEAARQAAAAVESGGGSVVDSIDVHFLAPGLVGPFLATVQPLSERSSLVMEVEVTDEGNGGRPVALGMVGLRREP
jgi:acyl-coenzyme A thioesterase PaaI-like protein